MTRRLTINKRLDAADPMTKKYNRYLTKLATGVINDHEDRIKLPLPLKKTKLDEIVDFVFPPEALGNPLDDDQLKRITGSALLCPTNAETLRINKDLMVTVMFCIK